MKCKMKPAWRDNKGAALILVIVCIAFVGILGVTVLAATVTNRDMKFVDERAKENFYSTESGVDIFLANLQKMSEEALAEEYTYLLTHYTTSGSERLKKGVISRLWTELTGLADVTEDTPAEVKEEAALALFLGVKNYGTDFKMRNYTAAAPPVTVQVDEANGELVLMGLSISNVEDGYETQITTDVRIAVEFRELDIETPVTTAGTYHGYVIVSDGTVTNMLTGSNIVGSVYAGKDLTAEQQAVLTLSSDNVVVGGTLQTAVGGKLSIDKRLGGAVRVWAGNVMTASGGRDIAINNSECYVADDLVLASEGAAVTIGGSYYGYHRGTGGTGKNSSAITINAGKSKLDMSGLDELWLAGRSFVNVPDLYGADGVTAYKEIMEGETISYKGNQLAYLVPEECIREYGHNPLTKKEYDAIAASGGIASYIDTSASFGDAAVMTLAPYVNADACCEVVPVRFMSEPEPLYYVYLKFRSSKAAEEYFLAYSNAFREQMDMYSGILNLGDVILPDSEKIHASGTVLRVTDKRITEVLAGNLTAEQAAMKQMDCRRRFAGLLGSLNEDYTGAAAGTAVENILRVSEIEKLNSTKRYYFDSEFKPCEAGAVYQVIVADGDFSAASENITGLILANGNVNLSGSTFRGIVLATGDVTLNAMTMTDTNADGTDFVKQLLDNNSSVSRFFRNYPLIEEGEEEEEQAEGKNVTITLENWFKN